MERLDRVRPDAPLHKTRLRHSQKLESIGMLAAGIAHEINNPLCGIMSYAQVIRDQRGEQDSDLDDFARRIIQETERAATIVRHLASFAQQDQLGGCLAPVRDIVDAAAALLRTTLRHDQITLDFDLPEELPTICCHPQQIQQVIVNLATNARDALNEKYPGRDPAKRIMIRVHSRQDSSHRGTALDLHLVESVTLPGLTGLSTLTAVNGQPSAVRITVEDNGTGIPEHLHQRIFEPSFTTKPTDRGTGLGLAISKDIVEDHDGELSLESHPGHWTRFHVDLPAKPRAFGGTGLRTSSGHSAENCGSDWTREMLACQTQN